ncbi:MAG TPA: hypothetical protein VMQ67_12935 [Candidatus Saccharimonadales bacterium]|jgi:hypothetical protein|nr:hypothetical protein [Candidatus Saccharimonadales bacterium]
MRFGRSLDALTAWTPFLFTHVAFGTSHNANCKRRARPLSGLTACDDRTDAGSMKLLEFKSGKEGGLEFINPEAVAWVHTDGMPQKGGTYLTVIGTLDGKEHRVQGALADVAAILARQ